MARLRAALILIGFLGITLPGMPVQWLLLKLRLRAARTFPHRYHRIVAALFGIHIKVVGKPVSGEGVLMLANHTSWADIIIFSAVAPISFVAKAEVARWPFFGSLARLQRTVFVERTRRSTTGETRDAIRERLLDGVAGLAGGAADGRHVKVQPVSTAFTGLHGLPMGRENRPLFAWYGDMEMVPHLWEAILAGPLDVVVQFHEPLSLDMMDRKALAARAQEIVQSGQAEALAGRS